MIAVLVAVVIGLVAWILVLYNQAPGGVNFPTIIWPDSESEEQISCGGSVQCPDGYTCKYQQYAELGYCAKDQPARPRKLTCGGITGEECPEGYDCVYDKDDEDVIDRAGECKKR